MHRARVSSGGSVIYELNYDWLRISTTRKSFCRSDSQTLFFGGEKRQPEIRLRSQATWYAI